MTRFYPLGPRGYCSPFVRRLRRTQLFGYYTNIVQQIEFMIHTNIQPLPAIFLLKVKNEKNLANAITWKVVVGSLQLFIWR